jgi:hypothetical protein
LPPRHEGAKKNPTVICYKFPACFYILYRPLFLTVTMKKNTPTCENCPNAARSPLLKLESGLRKIYCDRLTNGEGKVSKPLSDVQYLKCFIEDENFKSLSFYRSEPFKRWLTDVRNIYPVHDN